MRHSTAAALWPATRRSIVISTSGIAAKSSLEEAMISSGRAGCRRARCPRSRPRASARAMASASRRADGVEVAADVPLDGLALGDAPALRLGLRGRLLAAPLAVSMRAMCASLPALVRPPARPRARAPAPPTAVRPALAGGAHHPAAHDHPVGELRRPRARARPVEMPKPTATGTLGGGAHARDRLRQLRRQLVALAGGSGERDGVDEPARVARRSPPRARPSWWAPPAARARGPPRRRRRAARRPRRAAGRERSGPAAPAAAARARRRSAPRVEHEFA